VGIAAGSREVPGRNACDRRHTYLIIIIIIIIIIMELFFSPQEYFAKQIRVANLEFRNTVLNECINWRAVLSLVRMFHFRTTE